MFQFQHLIVPTVREPVDTWNSYCTSTQATLLTLLLYKSLSYRILSFAQPSVSLARPFGEAHFPYSTISRTWTYFPWLSLRGTFSPRNNLKPNFQTLNKMAICQYPTPNVAVCLSWRKNKRQRFYLLPIEINCRTKARKGNLVSFSQDRPRFIAIFSLRKWLLSGAASNWNRWRRQAKRKSSFPYLSIAQRWNQKSTQTIYFLVEMWALWWGFEKIGKYDEKACPAWSGLSLWNFVSKLVAGSAALLD